ncbi:MAG: cadmium-translocating P-type ATPase [Phycisphaeraceae bacterium]|nr:cadmium-translocating P-type ATPase [Phycisphaeraceae bacterium]
MTNSHACVHCGLPVPKARQTDSDSYCCFGCRMAHELSRAGAADESSEARKPGGLFLRLAIGIFLTMNIMVFSYFFYSQELFPTVNPSSRDTSGGVADASSSHYHLLVGVLSYLQMFLATAVVALLGLPLLADTVDGLVSTFRAQRRLRADANLLILTGVFAAYIFSILHTLQGSTKLYFDTASVILVLVTLGSYLDSGAKRRATEAARGLLQSIPDRAFVRRAGDEVEDIPADDVRPGDVVRVRPGETITVDGVVLSGQSHVQEAHLTGESRPRPVAPDDKVLAGSTALDGLLWITAHRAGPNRTIAQLHRLLEEARLHQPPIQRVADRIAAVFVPGVMVLALAVFAWHLVHQQPQHGLFDALSVLLISCPCALGLSAPLATWCAMAHAARRGILFQSGQILERAAGVTDIFYDKTGTLTTGQMRLTRIDVTADQDETRVLALAAAVESASTHPIALAISHEAKRRGLTIPLPTTSRVLPGAGVEATVEGTTYRLGGPRLLPDMKNESAEPAVFLVHDGAVLATFTLAEQLRPDARDAVAWHRRLRHRVEMLTGDQPRPARRVAEELNIPMATGLLPREKLDQLEARRGDGRRRVAMVGDGVNDAPALAAADVGVALAGGTDLAKQAGHILIVGDQLLRVPEAFAIARHAIIRIRLNLLWAFGYNIIGLTLASFGLLSPVFAASSMIVSSLLIITTSRKAGQIPV